MKLPFSKGIERGAATFTGGQCDLDENGGVLNAGDGRAQIAATARNGIDVLRDLDLAGKDMIHARCFSVGLDVIDAERTLRAALDAHGASRASASVVPLAALYYEGMRIETDFFACRGPCLRIEAGVRADAASPEKAVQALADALERRLAPGELRNVLHACVYWPRDWDRSAIGRALALRASIFGENAPAFSDIVVDSEASGGWPRLDAIVLAEPGQQARERITLDGACEGIRIGRFLTTRGIVAGRPGLGIVEQTRACMDRLDAILAAAGFARADIAKMTTFYVGGATAAELHENLGIRAARFAEPGPASTGVPVPALIGPDDKIMVNAIAIKEDMQ